MTATLCEHGKVYDDGKLWGPGKALPPANACLVCHARLVLKPKTKPVVKLGKPQAKPRSHPLVANPCVHLGADTGERVTCQTCRGKVELKILLCAVHGRCTVGKAVPGTACCSTCPDFSPAGSIASARPPGRH